MRECGAKWLTCPNVTKHDAVGALAVTTKVLRHDRSNRHGDSNKAVVINTNPDNIEPG